MAERINITGSFSEVGFLLGQRLCQQTRSVVETMKQSELYSKLQAYIKTPEGGAFYNQLAQTTRTYCSEHVQELKGVAEGAGVTYDDLFLMNVSIELATAMEIVPTGSHGIGYASVFSGCTNVSIVTEDQKVYFVHTEDIAPYMVGKCVMLSAIIRDTDGRTIENWTEHVVPGILPGGKFGFNCHGMMHADNSVFQKELNRRGIPIRFMARKLLPAKSVEEVKSILLQTPGIASAFSFTLLKSDDVGNNHVIHAVLETVGTETGTKLSEFHPQGSYFHCNMFQHLPNPCHPEESSIHRAAVIAQYIIKGNLKTKHDLLKVVSDDKSPTFPVYRTGNPPDYLATAATGLFDLQEGTLTVYEGKPSDSQPNLVLMIGNE